jgi:hypothetical protein
MSDYFVLIAYRLLVQNVASAATVNSSAEKCSQRRLEVAPACRITTDLREVDLGSRLAPCRFLKFGRGGRGSRHTIVVRISKAGNVIESCVQGSCIAGDAFCQHCLSSCAEISSSARLVVFRGRACALEGSFSVLN